MNRLLIASAMLVSISVSIFAPELRSMLGLKPQPTTPERTYWCLDETTNRNYECDRTSFMEHLNDARVKWQRQSDKDLEMWRKYTAESEARDKAIRAETERLYNGHTK